jgi:hypothetical protein
MLIPVPGIEPGSFRCFNRIDRLKAEYPSLWTIPEMVLLMKECNLVVAILPDVLKIKVIVNASTNSISCVGSRKRLNVCHRDVDRPTY